ncbi:MAG: gamma-glutamyltransferase [Abditibacteriales bacterium]|nr:gamma-glutamyltransferase [Abditibacteriales bacterium]MDW8367572.1 gamma-glutamyltransferase [Abditibacteriales bacterium]
MARHSFTAHRPVAMGTRGMVASAHALASLAGLKMLMDGGNAVDAAVATAAALNVVEPFMSGMGGVGIMLFHQAKNGVTQTLNFGGRAPDAARPELFDAQSKQVGIRAPMVPGNLAGWLEALEKHGTMSREKVFTPAIEYAERGVPMTHFGHRIWEDNAAKLRQCPYAAATYLIDGRVPAPGEILRQPDLARTFRKIVEQGKGVFYEGEIAHAIADFCAAEGGLIALKDLRDYQPVWQDVIATDYRGYTVCTAPPNSEGFQMLETLNILEAFDLASMPHNSAEYLHLLIEAVKIAAADRIAYAGDPDWCDVPIAGLLSKAYAAERRKLINRKKANVVAGERWVKDVPEGAIKAGNAREYLPKGTTHFCIVDAEGNAVSITQTLGGGFGCGRVVPGTGIALNNGINWMEIDPACDTPNLIAGGKRAAWCLSPMQVFRDGKLFLAIGTPGSYGILHTTLQMFLNIVEFGANVQEAIEAPRVRIYGGTNVEMEERIPADVRDALTQMGHTIHLLPAWSPVVGGGHGIMVHPISGAYLGGADPRRDGCAMGW